jgi:hypothetical protein
MDSGWIIGYWGKRNIIKRRILYDGLRTLLMTENNLLSLAQQMKQFFKK